MLFNYRYVNHSIEGFQVYLDHLVKEVWCKVPSDFSVELLHPDLQQIVLEIYDTEENIPRGKTRDWLYGPIVGIYEIFRTRLTPGQREQVAAWYDHNNDIEALCVNDSAKVPGTYSHIEAINADLAKLLKLFCQSLYPDVIDLKAVSRRVGEIDDHYNAFVRENNEGKCPYCGYGEIKSERLSRREAYDHYLPKGTYPFNSVNFKNLAPMCHECNSSYKLQKDPISRANNGGRRKAFYTYSTRPSDISVALTLKSADIDKLCPTDIDLQITAPGKDEEVEAWKEIFGIEERYKAKCCGKNDGKYWLAQAVEECANVAKTAQEMLQAIEKTAAAAPWAECNFLKKPFLMACRDAGLIR